MKWKRLFQKCILSCIHPMLKGSTNAVTKQLTYLHSHSSHLPSRSWLAVVEHHSMLWSVVVQLLYDTFLYWNGNTQGSELPPTVWPLKVNNQRNSDYQYRNSQSICHIHGCTCNSFKQTNILVYTRDSFRLWQRLPGILWVLTYAVNSTKTIVKIVYTKACSHTNTMQWHELPTIYKQLGYFESNNLQNVTKRLKYFVLQLNIIINNSGQKYIITKV